MERLCSRILGAGLMESVPCIFTLVGSFSAPSDSSHDRELGFPVKKFAAPVTRFRSHVAVSG